MNKHGTIDRSAHYRLSRYVQITPLGEALVAQSIVTGRQRVLPNISAVRLLLSLTRTMCLSELLAKTDPKDEPRLLEFFAACFEDGLLTQVFSDGSSSEEKIAFLVQWEHHDLTFHLRSRRGRNPYPVGATWPKLTIAPPVVEHAGESTRAIALPAPDLEQLKLTDWTLSRVLESRRSRYRLDTVPLPLLGELLFRACRVTGSVDVNGETLLRKVYPSGGARHSLIVYVVAHRCTGLVRGCYRYNPRCHRLEWCQESSEAMMRLLQEAQVATGILRDLPSVLLIFASDLGQVTRKYQSNAYRLILQEVGAVFQTIYLVGETLGLAVSAIGAGDSECFSRACGADFFGEPSVGEMILAGPEQKGTGNTAGGHEIDRRTP